MHKYMLPYWCCMQFTFQEYILLTSPQVLSLLWVIPLPSSCSNSSRALCLVHPSIHLPDLHNLSLSCLIFAQRCFLVLFLHQIHSSSCLTSTLADSHVISPHSLIPMSYPRTRSFPYPVPALHCTRSSPWLLPPSKFEHNTGEEDEESLQEHCNTRVHRLLVWKSSNYYD